MYYYLCKKSLLLISFQGNLFTPRLNVLYKPLSESSSPWDVLYKWGFLTLCYWCAPRKHWTNLCGRDYWWMTMDQIWLIHTWYCFNCFVSVRKRDWDVSVAAARWWRGGGEDVQGVGVALWFQVTDCRCVYTFKESTSPASWLMSVLTLSIFKRDQHPKH